MCCVATRNFCCKKTRFVLQSFGGGTWRHAFGAVAVLNVISGTFQFHPSGQTIVVLAIRVTTTSSGLSAIVPIPGIAFTLPRRTYQTRHTPAPALLIPTKLAHGCGLVPLARCPAEDLCRSARVGRRTWRSTAEKGSGGGGSWGFNSRIGHCVLGSQSGTEPL